MLQRFPHRVNISPKGPSKASRRCSSRLLSGSQSLPWVQYRTLATTASLKAPAVRILEVGPRDGLQNIKQSIATPLKVELIQRLAEAGLSKIEATSFVSPKWVPQLADGAAVMEQILHLRQEGKIGFPVLAPNAKGLENAIKAGAKEVVVFASATDAFSKKNQNCTVDEALDAQQVVAEKALSQGLAVRGVVSCVIADPYSGPTSPSEVLYVVKRLFEMGCYEVGLGDTLGQGTPKTTQEMLELILRDFPADRLAGHFHDTYGQAVANVVRAYDMGLRAFDSSVAGLGGCPYAKGAKGNLATEDIVYTFEQSGIDTGINLEKLVSVGEWISRELGLPNGSRAGSALFAKQESSATQPAITPASIALTKSATSSPSRTWKQIQDTGDYSVSRSGNVVKITLTRPKNGNALTISMTEDLTKLFHDLAHDQSVFHIVLAATGKFFCTGMDLSGGGAADQSMDTDYYTKVEDLFSAIDNAPQTTIAVIDGPCYGGGVCMGTICDIRLVSSKARWTMSEIKLGLSPAIISRYMAREWGIPFMREAMLTGREVTPAEVQRIGAVHGVADDSGALEWMLEEKLDQLSICAPRSAAACKELTRLAWTDAGGREQDAKIKSVFDGMMKPGSEGKFGIEQFQKKVKRVDWGAFWAGKGLQAKL